MTFHDQLSTAVIEHILMAGIEVKSERCQIFAYCTLSDHFVQPVIAGSSLYIGQPLVSIAQPLVSTVTDVRLADKHSSRGCHTI